MSDCYVNVNRLYSLYVVSSLVAMQLYQLLIVERFALLYRKEELNYLQIHSRPGSFVLKRKTIILVSLKNETVNVINWPEKTKSRNRDRSHDYRNTLPDAQIDNCIIHFHLFHGPLNERSFPIFTSPQC